MTMPFVPRFAPDPSCHADVSNRECPRLATVYISSPSSVAGLTVAGVFHPATSFQRSCAECADLTPDLLSRQPLSSAVTA
jgi:hypothetical protein